MTIYTKDSGKKPDPNFVPPASKPKTVFSTLELLELEKAMLGRGVDYGTIQLILSDFDIGIRHLHKR